MKKKLLVLLIAASSMLMPNLASAIAVDYINTDWDIIIDPGHHN